MCNCRASMNWRSPPLMVRRPYKGFCSCWQEKNGKNVLFCPPLSEAAWNHCRISGRRRPTSATFGALAKATGSPARKGGPPAGSSRVAEAYLTSTLTLRVLASSRLGMLMVNTPSLKVASTLSASTTAGSLTVRVKEP